jgi:hypothetical protein
VRQWPSQQRRRGSSTACGSVRPAAALWADPLEREEGVRAGHERAVVVEAAVAAARVVVKAELALELDERAHDSGGE